jgi:hypothetical protein
MPSSNGTKKQSKQISTDSLPPKRSKSDRTPRELALLPVKDVPAKDRTARQKIERRLLHALYNARCSSDAKKRAAHTKQAAELEREIKALDKPRRAHKAA